RPAAAAEGLAVDGDVAQAQGGADGLDPAGEAALEGGGVQGGEDAVEGVVRGDAVGQGQAQRQQPGALLDPEGGDGVPGLRPGQDGGKGDDQDVAEQVVVAEGGVARVGEAGEVLRDVQPGRRGGGSHGRISNGRRRVRQITDRWAPRPPPLLFPL